MPETTTATIDLKTHELAYADRSQFSSSLEKSVARFWSGVNCNTYAWNTSKVYDYFVQRSAPIISLNDIEINFEYQENWLGYELSGGEFISLTNAGIFPIVWNDQKAEISVEGDWPKPIKLSEIRQIKDSNQDLDFAQHIKKLAEKLIQEPSNYDDAEQIKRYEEHLRALLTPKQ